MYLHKLPFLVGIISERVEGSAPLLVVQALTPPIVDIHIEQHYRNLLELFSRQQQVVSLKLDGASPEPLINPKSLALVLVYPIQIILPIPPIPPPLHGI
jgi:hypothetical protein